MLNDGKTEEIFTKKFKSVREKQFLYCERILIILNFNTQR